MLKIEGNDKIRTKYQLRRQRMSKSNCLTIFVGMRFSLLLKTGSFSTEASLMGPGFEVPLIGDNTGELVGLARITLSLSSWTYLPLSFANCQTKPIRTKKIKESKSKLLQALTMLLVISLSVFPLGTIVL